MREENFRRRNRRKRRKRLAKTLLFAVLFTIAAVYIGMSVYFMGHFSFNTYVNGQMAYKKTAAQLEEETVAGLRDYSLTVTGRDGVTDVIDSSSLELTAQMGSQFQDILRSQNAFIWPVYLFRETQLMTETVAGYDRGQLEQLVDKMNFFKAENIREPVDAHLSEESGENGFEVIAQDEGCFPVKQKVLEEIASALDVLEPEYTLSDDCYKRPERFSDDPALSELCENLNRYCSVNLTYHFGDDTVKVDGTRVRQWCTVDGTVVTFDEEKVRDFVNEIARKYDSFGKTRKLKAHSGETVEVSGGDYGWWMDRATEASELTQAIKNGEKGDRTPVYFGTACAYGDNDWGDTYVEINLTDQHLWVYKEGQVVCESDFVSGCVNKRRTTPVGTYRITYKERDATLVGENYSSAVKYWMPFNGNVGMHDASWRSEFGGNIYVASGSHGCINLPTSKAEKIYGLVEKGEPVLVYGGKTLPEKEEEEPAEDSGLTPEEQLQILIQMGYLNPDGTVPDQAPAQETPAQETPAQEAPAQDTGGGGAEPESSQEGEY